jgi:hypothetical protein
MQDKEDKEIKKIRRTTKAVMDKDKKTEEQDDKPKIRRNLNHNRNFYN